MLTAEEAYVKFKDACDDEILTQDISEYPSCYILNNAYRGDLVDAWWRIDKESGKVEKVTLLEYMDAVKELGEDDEPQIYTFAK